MARKGAAGRKRGRCFSSTSSSSIANKIVRNYCDYGKLIYSRIGRGIAFAKVKNSPTVAKRPVLVWLLRLRNWIRRYVIMGFMILHGKHAAIRSGYAWCVQEEIPRQILPWQGTWCWSLLHDMKKNITIGAPPRSHYYISKPETKIT